MYLKWYSLVVGLALVLVGLDPWLPTGPEVMVMPLAGAISIVVGLAGVVLAALGLKGEKKPSMGGASKPPVAPVGQ